MKNKFVVRISLLEAFCTSLVVGLAETYFPVFSLMKGASAIEAGVLTSVPLVLAGLFQWVLLKKIKTTAVSEWVPVAVLVQMVSLAALAACSVIASTHLFLVLMLIYSIYWLGHLAMQPAWNRWIYDLVPIDQSQYYFSLRTRIVQIGIVLGLILGGYILNLNILNLGNKILDAKNLFLGLFSFSCFLKYLSYRLFDQQTKVSTQINFDFAHAKNLFFKYKSFIKGYSLFNFSVYLSAPYVVSYLLVSRHLSYEQFMWVMVGLFVGKICTTLLLPRLNKNIAPFKLLVLGGIIAAPLPAFWPLCTEVWMLFVMHLFSGVAWGAWEVGLSLCFFKNLNIKEKIEMISIYNFVAILTQIMGTLVGAAVLKYWIHEDYNLLFVISGLIRVICVLNLRRKTFGETYLEPPIAINP